MFTQDFQRNVQCKSYKIIKKDKGKAIPATGHGEP
jgi:hypothetical protein